MTLPAAAFSLAVVGDDDAADLLFALVEALHDHDGRAMGQSSLRLRLLP
jgi:hypothetical protein